MNYQEMWLALFLFTSVFTSCNKDSNLVGPGKPPIWTQEQLQSLQIRGVCAAGSVIIVGGYRENTSYGYFFRSTDNGATWVMTDSFGINNTSPRENFVIYPSFTFVVYGADIFAGVGGGVNRGDIYRSTDVGITWSDKGISWPESGDGQTENINSFCATGENIFVGTLHGVFLSTDRGTTWKAANAGLTLPVNDITAIGTSLFAGTDQGGIFRSMNSGSSWNKVSATDYDFTSVTAIENKVFAGAFEFYEKPSTGGVFVSTDNGASWAQSDSGLTDHGVKVLIASGSNLYVGTNSGTYFSTNQGERWAFISTGSPADSMAILSLAVSNSSLVEGTLDGVWFYPLSQLSSVKNKATQVRGKEEGG